MLPADLVTAVSDATSGVGAAIEADLKQAAVVSGMGGTFEVDLDVLFGYYGKLTELYATIGQHIASLKATAYEGDLQCGGAAGRIVGAARAAEATAMSAGPTGMQGALEAIQQDVARHMASLKASYDAYIKADDDNAQILTAAAHPELANGTPGGKSSSLGW